MTDSPIDTSVLIAFSGIVVVILGVLAGRWGRKRLTIGDDRGDSWRKSYSISSDGGYGVALLGALLTIAALMARCVFDGGTP